jgi:hypothetical protein
MNITKNKMAADDKLAHSTVLNHIFIASKLSSTT